MTDKTLYSAVAIGGSVLLWAAFYPLSVPELLLACSIFGTAVAIAQYCYTNTTEKTC